MTVHMELLPTLEDLRTAQARLAPHLRRTPLLELRVPTPAGPRAVVAKLELLQHTGSFKARGAFNSLLQMEGREVLACSGGNHGLAVAYAAAQLGRRALIYVPKSAARAKVEAMLRLGAEVDQVGDVPAEAFAAAEARQRETGWPLVHPYNQAPVIAGQGTLGLELREQAPAVTHWLAAVGGGGLHAGLLLGLDGGAELVAVEPEGCPTLAEAQKAGKPVPVQVGGVARTSLGGPSVGALPWEILKGRLEPVSLVGEEAILEAQRWLWREARLVAEPGGAAALAALMSGAWLPPDKAVPGVVLCGSNADALPE